MQPGFLFGVAPKLLLLGRKKTAVLVVGALALLACSAGPTVRRSTVRAPIGAPPSPLMTDAPSVEPEPASPPPPARDAPEGSASTPEPCFANPPADRRYGSVRRVPWRNMPYRVFGPGRGGAIDRDVRVRGGSYEERVRGFWFGVTVGAVAFGDLDGDGVEEAVVSCTQSGEGLDENAQWVFGLSEGRLVRLAWLEYDWVRRLEIDEGILFLYRAEPDDSRAGRRPRFHERYAFRLVMGALREDESLRTTVEASRPRREP